MVSKPSYWHSPGTKPLSHLTVGQLLDIAAERWGDREAVIFKHHRMTYEQVRDKVNCISFLRDWSANLSSGRAKSRFFLWKYQK
jgi:acyl-CoA synthetase (AMP-forming)/AMP-acid ligase II